MVAENTSAAREDMKVRDRRRLYLIDRDFQFRFLTTWLLMTLGFIVIVIAILFVGLRLVKMLPGDEASAGEAITLEKLGNVLKYNAAAIILITILLALYTVFLSHRIAGPAYRLAKCLDRIASGDYSFTVVLRKRDYLKGIADATNRLIQKLVEQQQLISEARAEVEKLVASLGPSATEESRNFGKTALERLTILTTKSKSDGPHEPPQPVEPSAP